MIGLYARIVDDLDSEGAVARGAQPNDLLPPRPEDKVGGELGKRFSETLRRDLERGAYDPKPAYIVAVPKSLLSTRPAALLPLADRAVYDAIVTCLRPRIEDFMLGDSIVLWPRGLRCDKQWREFEESPLKDDCDYILRADVSGFYESVLHDRLADVLIRATGRREHVDALVEFLNRTMGSNRGLPQGLEPSDALATVYLAEVDSGMIRDGYRYTRHGDDIRVAAETYEDGRGAILSFESRLRRVGLFTNSSKTRVLRRETYERGIVSIKRVLRDTQLQLADTRVQALTEDSDALSDALQEAGLDQLGWDFFYHGNVSLEEVILALEPFVKPNDIEVAEQMLHSTIQDAPGTSEGLDAEVFHQRVTASLVRLAAGRSTAALECAGWLLKSFPDKTEVVCSYLLALAGTEPVTVAREVAEGLSGQCCHTEWESAWVVRVGVAVAEHLDTNLVTNLRAAVDRPEDQWLLAVEVAKLLGHRGELERHEISRMWETCPGVFRADLILAAAAVVGAQPWADGFLSAAQEDPIHAVVVRHVEGHSAHGE